ncbi:phosphotransferase family protein [Streptomyces albus]|uniref:phosphotransferase family protein n=1 Tax=Streptomyces albus TaxID=1888 RepID=UPI0004CC2744|nr:aminoglycoside phosphotransferase family protein [Streptomyces albus]
MPIIDGRVPPTAHEITTGQANRVWLVDAPTPYVLKHYGTAARATNEAATLRLLAAHGSPAPRLLRAGTGGDPPWTAQRFVTAESVPAGRLLAELAIPLNTVHRIPGDHAGRVAGALHYPTWPAYLHSRLEAYETAAPHLASEARSLRNEINNTALDVQPRLLHHDLQPGHLIRQHTGQLVLVDWELAAFGDPLSDLARLAVRLRLDDLSSIADLVHVHDAATEHRLRLYWRIHRLADAALSQPR